MKLTRRMALMLLPFAPYLKTGPQFFSLGGGKQLVDYVWSMDNVKDFIIEYKGEKVVIPAAEMFAAIKDESAEALKAIGGAK